MLVTKTFNKNVQQSINQNYVMSKFKNFMSLTFAVIVSVVMISCSDEPWDAMSWSVVNSNTDDIQVTLKLAQNTVVSSRKGGKVVFTCENYDDLYIDAQNGIIFNEMVSVENNKIVIELPPIADDVEESMQIFFVKTHKHKKPLTCFVIYREVESAESD